MDTPKIFSDSFNDIFSNPKAILPSLILSIILILIIIATVLIFFSGAITSNIILFINSPSSFISNTLLLGEVIKFLIEILLIIFIISFLISMFMNGIFVAMANQLIRKEKLNIRNAISLASSRYINLLGAGIISIAIVLVAIAVPLSLIILTFYIQVSLFSFMLAAIFAILLLILLIFATIYIFQVTTVIIIENKKPIDAIKRSFQIAAKKRTDIFIVLVLMALINITISFLSGFFELIPFVGILITLIIDISASVWFGMVPVYFYYASGSNINQNQTLQKIKKKLPNTRVTTEKIKDDSKTSK